MSQDTPEQYVSASSFAEILTSPIRVKLLDVLLRKHYTKLTVTELNDFIDADMSEIFANLEILVNNNLVIESEVTDDIQPDTEFDAYKYSINKNSTRVKTMRKLQTLFFRNDNTEGDGLDAAEALERNSTAEEVFSIGDEIDKETHEINVEEADNE